MSTLTTLPFALPKAHKSANAAFGEHKTIKPEIPAFSLEAFELAKKHNPNLRKLSYDDWVRSIKTSTTA